MSDRQSKDKAQNLLTEEKPSPKESMLSAENLLPSENIVSDLAELFKTFGDPTRTKILICLQKTDLYVGEIANYLGMSVSAVSHQLRILRTAKLVKSVKEGKEVKYSLDDDHVTQILSCGLTHVEEEK